LKIKEELKIWKNEDLIKGRQYGLKRYIKQYVQIVDKKQRFHLNQQKIGRFIAGLVISKE
jgi:hypothetical protein